jgi:hypothetical protein
VRVVLARHASLRDLASLRSVHSNRVPNKGRRIRHRQPMEFRKVRIDDVIVAVSEVAARQAPTQDSAAVDVLLDGIPRRELRWRVHSTRAPLLVNQEKLHALPAKRAVVVRFALDRVAELRALRRGQRMMTSPCLWYRDERILSGVSWTKIWATNAPMPAKGSDMKRHSGYWPRSTDRWLLALVLSCIPPVVKADSVTSDGTAFVSKVIGTHLQIHENTVVIVASSYSNGLKADAISRYGFDSSNYYFEVYYHGALAEGSGWCALIEGPPNAVFSCDGPA